MTQRKVANPANPVPPVAGVDGCRAGWVVVTNATADGRWRASVEPDFPAVLAATAAAAIVGVDMPIGLPAAAVPGGRACDAEARTLVGRGRTSSIFSPPCRGVLAAPDYPIALAINRASSPHGLGFSKQAWNIVARIREVDAAIDPALQRRVVEVHPELCFIAMNGGRPLADGKKTPAGATQRRRLLRAAGFRNLTTLLRALPRALAAPDDILDACAAAWTAARVAAGTAIRIPANPPRDPRGLAMEIWR
jgi:predicted RNase H-like nuclease